MKKLLQLEEMVMFASTLYFYPFIGLSWWWFAGCILLPDLGMIGYAANPRIGAYTYNVLHHRGVAVLVLILGLLTASTIIQFTGFILLSHACLDRMLGYGLKYEKGFRYTHLGEVGNNAEAKPGL